jgi:hypothetical protein
VQAVLALLAPAVFTLALWSTLRRLAGNRHEMLSELHRGTERLLPEGVSIYTHHRAWSQCTALPATSRDELAELVHESGAELGHAGQPRLGEIWKRLAHSPGCAVKVIDRDDAQVEFGGYILFPLLADTVRRIRSGQLTANRELKPADLAASPDDIAGWYILVIWAPGPKWTLRCVLATLVDALAVSGAGSSALPVFAQPVTDQGRSLIEGYGFAAASTQADAIWVLEK